MGSQVLIPAIGLVGALFGNKNGGNGVQTVVQRHHVQDPAILRQLSQSNAKIAQLQNMIQKYQKDLAQAHQKAKAMKDPKLFKSLKQESFQMFLNNLQTLNFEEKIPKQNGQRHYVLIGNISSGKSSLINYSCGTNLKVGLGQTTTDIRKVARSQNGLVHIWDSPGVNQDFAFYDINVLAYFHSADRIFILYPDSLKSCKDMIRVLSKIKPTNTFLVRTKCDQHEKTHEKTVEQEVQTDKLLLEEWGIKMPVLATSTKKHQSFMDNMTIKGLLNGT